jgi:hypothetical protein
MQFTREELIFLIQTLSQVHFKIGQSDNLKMAENINGKIQKELQKSGEST